MLGVVFVGLGVFVVTNNVQSQSLFISQYIETNSGTTPKGIEVYNSSGADIVFSVSNNLQIFQGTNGAACAAIALTNTTSGTLRAGETWVIGTLDLTTYASTNGTAISGITTYTFTFNGDDALQLYLGGVLMDVFGTCGSDPGSAWLGSGVSTADQNIQTTAGICFGTTTSWTDPSLRFELVDAGSVMTGFGNAPNSCSGLPTLNLSTSSLSGLTYIVGSGPSTSQSYNLSGFNLTGSPGNITITGSTNYEVSTDNSTFSGSVIVPYTTATLASTPIYVRLKTGLSVGTYNGETISNAGGGATTVNVTCNGNVTAIPPNISVTPATLSGFIYNAGSGPSVSQSYNLSGSNLTGFPGNITITGSTDFEVSTDNSTFSGSVSVPYASATLASTPIYVRLKAGLVAGTYNSELIANSGGGATTVNVSCSGTVTAIPNIDLSSSNPAVTAANIPQGSIKVPIYKFSTAVTVANTILNSVSFTTTNSNAADLVRYQLWYKNTDFFAQAVQIGTDITTSMGSGVHTFSGFSQSILIGETGYFWITADVSYSATIGNTFEVSSAITTSDLIFVSGNKTGTARVGGKQTIIAGVPKIIATPSTLTGFDYYFTYGPSAEQTFTASGAFLTSNISVTAPTDYEISLTSGSGFTSVVTLPQIGGFVSATTVYVRLKAGLAVGAYNSEVITLASTGAANEAVTCAGTVFPTTPAISVSPTVLYDFTYVVGAGPSAEQTFTVSGVFLTANADLIAPAGYEISLTSGAGFASSLSLSPTGGTLTATTIYVRLKSGLVVGTYNWKIINATSTGAITKTITCHGTVTIIPCISEGFNGYNGGTRPVGWTFTNIPSTGTYTALGSYGIASPSLKLDNTGDIVLTATVSGATELSFWIEGQVTDAISALLVEGLNGTWSTIENINPLPTSGITKTYNSGSTPTLALGFTQFRFTYTKSLGNLAFDDVKVICNSVANTITTGTVSAPPFTVNCSASASGSVTFTSTGAFTANTYSVQLSDASGSFAIPLTIGTLESDANAGTINFTIPAGRPAGSNYTIRVVSNNPVVTGTSSSTFTINSSGTPCSFFEIESILVDACGDGSTEGENEMFRFQVGSAPLNTADITVMWPNNSWLGICQNSTTAATIAAINATITAGGQILEPTNGVIPDGAQVMFFTNTQFIYSNFDFSNLNYILYAIFQCEDNEPGHFVNYTTPCPQPRTLTLTFNNFSADVVTYDACEIYSSDGAVVDFDAPGNPTYSTSGQCSTVPLFPVNTLPIELAYFKATCSKDEVQLHWVTMTETNNAFFTIESSDNINEFRPIAVVQGAGNSNEMLEYSIDVETKAKYFRLKQTDFDGKFTYSDVIAVDCEDNHVQLFPTIALEGENINILGEVSSVRVFDSMGREVRPEVIDNKVCCLEAGMYFFVINGKSNFKVVVQ